ncbi:MAG: CoA pyrophosphatase [Caulobacterales bacterium]
MILNGVNLEDRLRERLVPPDRLDVFLGGFDNQAMLARTGAAPGPITYSAVLVPLVRRSEGWTMLLTQRADETPTHAGHVAFPGGRVQPEDRDVIATALREAEEETGISRALFTPVGVYDPFVTRNHFRITPVVALINPSFSVNADPREVADIFETPLSYLFDAANYRHREQHYEDETFFVRTIEHDGRNIWGVTAILIEMLLHRLFADAIMS